MRTRKLGCLAVLLLAVGMNSAHAAKWDTIRFATEGAYPPFNDLDASGKLIGFEVEFVQALCQAIKAKCVLSRTNWSDAFTRLNARHFDAVIDSIVITDARRQQVAFTDKYLSIPNTYIAKSSKFPWAYIAPQTLEGYRLGIQSDSVFDSYASDPAFRKVKVLRYGKAPEMYAALVKGDVDIVLDSMASAYYGFLNTAEGRKFSFVGSPIRNRALNGDGEGIAVRKGDQDLLQLLNRGIAETLKNGSYHRIAGKYFVFDPYGR